MTTAIGTAPRLAFAQSAPKLVAAPLPVGRTLVRLVSPGRDSAANPEWTVEYRRGDRPGHGLQIMVSTRRGRTTIDSLMFETTTLSPIWQHTAGALRSNVSFGNGRIRGQVRMADGTSHAIDIPSVGPVYSTTMDDIVSSRVPFSVGYQAVLSFWVTGAIETDTARVVSHENANAEIPTSHWIVELREPGTIETFWVEERSRRIARHSYTRRDNGARSTVVSSPARSDR